MRRSNLIDMSDFTSHSRPHVAILTAGGAGMFCGSCLHDNTWARVLHASGYEVSLIPAYTPIRVDEENLSSSRVYFGGINVYLNSRWAWWRNLPQYLKRGLDRPGVIRALTRWGLSTEAKELGEITVAMLQGLEGPNRDAIEDLANHLAHLKPNVILFTNALLAGALRGIRAVCPANIWCILQGDDIFLEGLAEPYKFQVLHKVRELAEEFDGFVVQSRYYRDFMSDYLQISREKFHYIPLTIDCAKHDGRPKSALSDPPVIGYFARICEEKGLHQLVEACVLLRQRMPRFRLLAGGYLGADRRSYFNSVVRLAKPLGSDFEYIGSPDTHAEKVAFFKRLDVFSVPTVYREPKGLTVLEALANGVPVVQPAHGAFPELMESTGGGVLFPPGNAAALADHLELLLMNSETRRELAQTGWSRVRSAHGFPALATASREFLEFVLAGEQRHVLPVPAQTSDSV